MRLLLPILVLVLPAVAWASEPFDPFGKAGIDAKPAAAAPMDRPFTDEMGQATTLRRLAGGKPLLLIPVQHHCPSLCGLTLEGMRTAIARQDFKAGKDFTVIAFGVDPHEDAKAAAQSVGRLGGEAHATIGAERDIRAVTDALGYRYAWDPASAQYAHIAAVAALSSDGRLAGWIKGLDPDPAQLRLALVAAGHGQVGRFSDQIRLLCFHYDAVQGRYAPIIWTVLRWAGGLTVLALVGGILLAVRRRPRARPA